MIEFDVDMDYLLEYDELDKVVLNDENGEHEPMEFVPADAKAGNRSCASCPEMDNPDSYIVHLHRALEVADKGAGTCHFKVVINQDPSRRGRGNICECDKCGYRCARGFIEDERFKHCPNCGKRIVKED